MAWRRPQLALVDAVVVVVILLVTLNVLLPSGEPTRDDARKLITRTNMQQVASAIDLYHADTEAFLEGIPRTGELPPLVEARMPDYIEISDVLHDAWQRPILYERSAQDGVEFIRLRSLGRDGKPDAPGDDSGDDIVMDIGLVGGFVVSRDPKRGLEWPDR